jgi:rhomboid protease GluP
MKNFAQKFRLIFIPFFLIAVGTNCVYSFLHWLLFIKGDIQLDEQIINFWLPAALSAIPLFIWLRPRIKLLKLNTKGRRDPVALYMFIAWLTIGISMVIAQDYLVTATGKLTKLDNINQISQVAKTKYYTIGHFYANKKMARIKTSFEVSGKHNEYFEMHIYAPCPIFTSEDTSGTFSGEPAAWLAVSFFKSISNNLSVDEKQAAFTDFARESQQDFDKKNLSDFVYLDRINYSSDFKHYSEAINSDKYPAINKKIIILSPVNEPFEARNGNKLPWIFGSLAIGFAVFLIGLLFAPLRRNAETVDLKAQGTKERANTLVWTKGIFSYKSGMKITRLLIGLNLLMFIIMVCAGLGFLSFSGEDLLKWGADFRPLVLSGQYWRLFTCMFLHGGVMHVLFNMYGLFFVGIFLEPVLGSKKFLIAYLITGIISSVASVWWHPATVSVGASGAIFGMYGVFFSLLTVDVFPPEIKKPFLINTLVFIGYNLLNGLTGGIDNAAHIGGLLSGFALGYILYFLYRDQLVKKPKISHQDIVDEMNDKKAHDVIAE